ncbi:MAG TPA: hypothetical protein VFY32_18865, partial [Solirubrobacteraceae bacterium]|nr:hypothetical protein [Solirubrobacteraceae bacterium]
MPGPGSGPWLTTYRLRRSGDAAAADDMMPAPTSGTGADSEPPSSAKYWRTPWLQLVAYTYADGVAALAEPAASMLATAAAAAILAQRELILGCPFLR